jgi:outer membrane protein OmpA-like peptidoglycan-associated protein
MKTQIARNTLRGLAKRWIRFINFSLLPLVAFVRFSRAFFRPVCILVRNDSGVNACAGAVRPGAAVRAVPAAAAALSIAVLGGCAAALIGLGAGMGAFAYVGGTLSRTYESGYREAARAGMEALKALSIEVVDTVEDGAGTAIQGRLPDGTPVEITLIAVEEERTEVGVRTGRVGVWDYGVSKMIHVQIAKRLADEAAAQNPPAALDGVEETRAAAEPPENGDPDAGGVRAAIRSGGNRKSRPAAAREPAGYRPQTRSDLVVFFGNDTNELSEAGKETLERVAAESLRRRLAAVTLHGYADSAGAAGYNFLLSVARAQTAKAYLVSKGVEADKVMVVGHGASNFLAGNETEGGRKLNRRVEIELHASV